MRAHVSQRRRRERPPHRPCPSRRSSKILAEVSQRHHLGESVCGLRVGPIPLGVERASKAGDVVEMLCCGDRGIRIVKQSLQSLRGRAVSKNLIEPFGVISENLRGGEKLIALARIAQRPDRNFPSRLEVFW